MSFDVASALNWLQSFFGRGLNEMVDELWQDYYIEFTGNELNYVPNGPEDCYKHTFVSAWLTLNAGYYSSYWLFNFHEWEAPTPGLSHRMDLLNNEIGRLIGRKYQEFLKDEDPMSDRYQQKLTQLVRPMAAEIADLLNRGVLVTNLEDPRLEYMYPHDPKLTNGKEGISWYEMLFIMDNDVSHILRRNDLFELKDVVGFLYKDAEYTHEDFFCALAIYKKLKINWILLY